MKTFVWLFIFFFITDSYSQEMQPRAESIQQNNFFGIGDRAAGVHNAGNVGLFFENRGKLYPRLISQVPSGEYPLFSGRNYIYRMNPMIGITGNVIQSRYSINEEWEAVGGYHNPNLLKIAFSDNPSTWHPVNGWPVKDNAGNPIILSNQDSYCVYSDSNNSISLQNIVVHQTGYVFSADSSKDIIFFKYQVVNNSNNDLDSIYFAMYCDIDVGDIRGGVPEFEDDRIGFDKENHFLYFFDDGFSSEWPGYPTGYFGIAFLQTPQTSNFKSGITDFHYNLYDDDSDLDTIQYGIISSSADLFNSPLGNIYFHIGSSSSLNFDDTSTIPLSGLDIVATISSGPHMLLSNQSLTFYTAILGGDNYLDIRKNLLVARNIYDLVITDAAIDEGSFYSVQYELSQNYPNPFNPSTSIQYKISNPANGTGRQFVTLKVYDVLGREVATLVNEEKEPGIYRTEFSTQDYQLASGISAKGGYASGVYLYRLQAGNFVETKKMILMK